MKDGMARTGTETSQRKNRRTRSMARTTMIKRTQRRET
jgi:hypothetical protein